MKKVKDIMVREVVSFKPSDPIHYVAWSLRDKRISGAPVLDGKKIVGIVSERDIMRLVEERHITLNLLLPSPFDVFELPFRMKREINELMGLIKKTAKTPVEEIMTKKVFTVSPNAKVSEAARVMGDKKINRLPVVDSKRRLLGIVTRGDIIGTLV